MCALEREPGNGSTCGRASIWRGLSEQPRLRRAKLSQGPKEPLLYISVVTAKCVYMSAAL